MRGREGSASCPPFECRVISVGVCVMCVLGNGVQHWGQRGVTQGVWVCQGQARNRILTERQTYGRAAGAVRVPGAHPAS